MLRLLPALLLFSATLASCGDDSPPTQTTATPTSNPTTTSAAPTTEPSEVTLRLLGPVPAQPVVGQQFTITVAIIGAANLGAYQFTPAYDRVTLELISITDLGFLATTGRLPTCSMTGTPPEPVTQFCVTIGAESAGPSGDANLALLQFRAMAAGETQIALERAIATMPDARDLPVVIEPVTVVVAP